MEGARAKAANQPEIPRAQRGLSELARLFLKIGATGFGGPMPVLAMIHSEVVDKKGWLTGEEYGEAMTLAQMLPGPVVVNTVTCIGYRLRGWPGAVLSATSFVLPSFVLMLILSVLYLGYGQTPHLAGAFRGLGGAVAAVVLAASWRMGKPLLKDLRSAALVLTSVLAVLFLHANIVLLVLLAGLIGMVLYREPARPPEAGGKLGEDMG